MIEDINDGINSLDESTKPSWIELTDRVDRLSMQLKIKAGGTALNADATQLNAEISTLCTHVRKLHSDVSDLVENVEDRFPIQEGQEQTSSKASLDCDEVSKEKIEIQRESHEMRSSFTDVLKALFMWVDDPEERVRNKR